VLSKAVVWEGSASIDTANGASVKQNGEAPKSAAGKHIQAGMLLRETHQAYLASSVDQ